MEASQSDGSAATLPRLVDEPSGRHKEAVPGSVAVLSYPLAGDEIARPQLLKALKLCGMHGAGWISVARLTLPPVTLPQNPCPLFSKVPWMGPPGRLYLPPRI